MSVLASLAFSVGALVAPTGSDYLFLWTADEDRAQEDFLAVMDVSRGFADFRPSHHDPAGGREIHGAPSHRARAQMPAANCSPNGFSSQHSFVFDLNEPEKPQLLTSFKPPAPFKRPHSYARLPNGNVLMTLQEQGSGEEVLPGGLIEVTARGDVVKTVDARDDKVDKRILLTAWR